MIKWNISNQQRVLDILSLHYIKIYIKYIKFNSIISNSTLTFPLLLSTFRPLLSFEAKFMQLLSLQCPPHRVRAESLSALIYQTNQKCLLSTISNGCDSSVLIIPIFVALPVFMSTQPCSIYRYRISIVDCRYIDTFKKYRYRYR